MGVLVKGARLPTNWSCSLEFPNTLELERDRVPSLFGSREAVIPTSFEAQDLPAPFRPRRPLGFRSSDAERSQPAVLAGLRGSQKSHTLIV